VVLTEHNASKVPCRYPKTPFAVHPYFRMKTVETLRFAVEHLQGVSWIYTSEHAPPNGMTAADSYFQPVRGIVLFILGDLMTMRSAIRRSRCLVRSAPTFGVPKAEYAKLDSLIRAAHFQNP